MRSHLFSFIIAYRHRNDRIHNLKRVLEWLQGFGGIEIIIIEQDKSPKVGFYVPGTLIEVKGDLELSRTNPEIVIVWAWHIIEEVCNYLESLGFVGEVWTPMPRFEMYRSFHLPQ